MRPNLRIALTAFVVPALIASAIGAGMLHITGQPKFEESVGDRSQPLNTRWGGYSAQEVDENWSHLKQSGKLAAEIRFLKVDLFYPLAYGGSLIAATVWLSRKRRIGVPTWLASAPATAAVLADWTENAIHLHQIGLYQAGAPPDAVWLQIASVATIIKLAAFLTAFLVLLAWAIRVARRDPPA